MKKIVVAVTGASGSVYARRLLKKICTDELASQISEIGVVFSAAAKMVMKQEAVFFELPSYFRVYSPKSFDAPFASGSAGYDAMIIIPCSMGTLARIASGISNDLIARAADVMLKERKRLIMVTREAPLNLIHIRNMATVTEAGAVVCPASPAFYHLPKTIEELADTVVDRVLQLAGLDVKASRWGYTERD